MEHTKLDSFETNGEQCDVGIVISMGIGRRFGDVNELLGFL